MREQRQNWHRFQKILGFLPSKKQGLAVLTSDRKILAGAVSPSSNNTNKQSSLHFQEEGMNFEHIESAHELLAHKYNAAGISFIDKTELMQNLAQLTSTRNMDSYYTQLRHLRKAFHIDSNEKSKLAIHLGDKPVQDFWPRENFIMNCFQAMFVELLPERRILLLGVIKSERERSWIALEFIGSEFHAFHHPELSHLEWAQESCDFFHRETVSRLVLWCENHYMLPTYAIIFSERLWSECCELQEKQGERMAWKHFVKTKQTRDAEPEILVEPEPWPLKACLRWNGMR